MSRVRLLVFLLAVLLVPSAVASGTSGIVVSQVYGGGGNAGAPFTHDFVELFNSGSTAVDVTGWTVQYATAAGTSWQATPLTGTIQPGKRFLVQLAGGTTGAPLPTPDATGTTNLSASNGKVALVRGADELACGAAPGSCASSALLEDLVGYGSASDFEGTGAAPAASSTLSVLRAGQGCTDTDVNAADFATGPPAPRSSADAVHLCASEEPPTGAPSASASASVDIEVDPALALSLERATLSFGRTTAGGAPAAISERVTVLSNHPAGYTLAVTRSAFSPADLPIAIQATAPPGGTLGSALGGGAFAAIPIAPSVLAVGTTSSASTGDGDVWPTNVGFVAPFPNVPSGRYTATLTFTVIGR